MGHTDVLHLVFALSLLLSGLVLSRPAQARQRLTPSSLSPVTGGSDLIHAYSWNGLEGASIEADGRLRIDGLERSIIGLPSGPDRGDTSGWWPHHAHHPDTPNPPINFLGPVIHAGGPFAISATLTAQNDRSSYLVFYGRVPVIQDEARREGEAVAVGIEKGHFQIKVWDGKSCKPAIYQLMDVPASTVSFTLIAHEKTFAVWVNGVDLGSIPNSGVFKSGLIFAGSDVASGQSLYVTQLSVGESPQDAGRTKVVSPLPFAPVAQVPGSLREHADQLGLNLGTAISGNALLSDDEYRERLAQNFNMITPENAMKFQFIHPSRNQYTFKEADEIVEFARANRMKVHAHTLAWGEAVPRWVSEGGFSDGELREILHEHVTTVVQHFKGQIDSWDVLNEPIENDGKLRQTLWAKALGADYPTIVFKWAYETDPAAKLYINEFGADGLTTPDGAANPRADGLKDLVLRIRNEGGHVDGVGLQMHDEINDYFPAESVDANFKRFQSLGIDVRVSEIDVKLDDDPSRGDLKKQAVIYGEALEACLDNRAVCPDFSLWGFEDKYSSLQSNEDMYEDDEGLGFGMIFDRQGRPKPAYNELLGVLSGEPVTHRSIKPRF